MDRDASQSGQLGLGFGDTKPSDRLFFALFPDAAAVAKIEELVDRLRREHGLRAKALRADHFHVTLHFLGDYPQDLWRPIAERAAQAASKVRTSPFDVRFDHVSSFASRRQDAPLVLRTEAGEALRELHATLGEALRGLGSVVRVSHGFEPHLTLMYDERSLAPRPINPISWRADEFVLVRSPIGKGEYEPLGRWPLRG
ncbi:RNA 2',3'-cyclic phosphodiesterase [Luteimonas gilva]|nr:RNA 2',3'-cyclic phosphodiesterase [Luteimonas gilva]